jgi:mannose-1-phosphate guanylyltransferase
VEHLKGLAPVDHIYIVTNIDLVAATRRILPHFPRRNIIGEPLGRDTAAAIALGAVHIQACDPRAVFCVLTADHVIGDLPVFRRTLKKAFAVAGASHCLLTIGMQPTFPSTAFGYIEAGPHLSRPGRQDGVEMVVVKRFVEKPDQATAARYLKTGRYFWNSGMFVWSADAFQEALARYRPPLRRLTQTLGAALGSPGFKRLLKAEYAKLEKISVDYAIMEKADNIVMVKGTFAWDDVGSWSALENHFAKDAGGNVVIGRAEQLDATGNIVVSRHGLVALLGVKDLVVVQTGQATLVCPKSRAQEIKKLVELLRHKRHHDAL